MKRLAIIATLLILTMPAAHADDLGMWLGATIEKKLSKQMSVAVDGEWRLRDNISATDRFSVGVEADYKIMPWLKADAGYKYLHSRQPRALSNSGNYIYNTYWYPRHRIFASLEGTWKLKRLKLSLRERWQYTYRPEFVRHRMNINELSSGYGTVSDNAKEGKAQNYLRSRLSAEYNIRKCPLSPFASVEMFNGWSIGKVRYSIGTDYKLDKHNSLKLYYMFSDRKAYDTDDDITDSHIIGIDYKYSF